MSVEAPFKDVVKMTKSPYMLSKRLITMCNDVFFFLGLIQITHKMTKHGILNSDFNRLLSKCLHVFKDSPQLTTCLSNAIHSLLKIRTV